MDNEEVDAKFKEIRDRWRAGEPWSAQEMKRWVENSPSEIKLAFQAVYAAEIIDEVKASVHLSTEEFTAWALEALSPYTDPVTMAEAHMAAVRHNIKMILRSEN